MKNAIIMALSILWLLSLFWIYRNRPEVDILRESDTIWMETVIRDSFPVPVHVEVIRYRIDTLRTIDSVFVPVYLPIERKEYETSDYKAVIEGYKPNLLSMEVYQRTQIITNTDTRHIKTPSRWGVGLQAGYGFTASGSTPYIGIGIQYNLINF